MNKGYLLGGAILIAVLVIAGVLLSNSNKKVATPRATQVPLTQTSDETLKADNSVREISVSAFEMGYTLSSTTLKRGETVKIMLSNTGKMKHDFLIEEMGIGTETIESGETTTLEFIVPMTGDLTYYCGVGEHRAMGMEGKFTIEE